MNKEEYPELYKEYDKVKNTVPFEDLRPSHRGKVWWVCPESGHSYLSAPKIRVYGKSKCSVCSGRTVSTGYNDLKSLHPDLAAEWDESKNALLPDEITVGSSLKVWWLCPSAGHSYLARPLTRIKQNGGCPYCSGYVPISGKNDLSITHPEISREWDVSRNTRDLLTVSYGSRYKAWWVCSPHGHHYRKAVFERTLANHGCPYCSGKRVLVGFNSLADTSPQLIREWSSNNSKTPYEVSFGSRYRATWVCDRGHSWITSVHGRRSGSGCPTCSKNSSKVEEFIRNGLNGVKARIPIPGWTKATCEVDCLIDECIVIEYDGSFWHKHKISTDISKSQGLINAGYSVIRVREQSNGNELPLLPEVKGLYQLRYEYDEKHTSLIPKLQDLLYTVRYDRLYLNHLENNDKGNR